MLQPAKAFIHRVQHEDIALVRRVLASGFGGGFIAVPKHDFGFANLFRIGNEPVFVERRQGPSHHQLVRHTAGGELSTPEGAHFHRAVHQLVVVRCGIQAKATGIDFDRR